MALRDSPRPSVYWPNTPSQWREPTVDDCTWYATEFAWQAASKDHISKHPVNDIRNHSIDTVGGTPIRVAMSETDRLWPKGQGVNWKYGSYSRAEIRRALIDGGTIIYGGDYAKLPPHYRRWTNNDSFSHAMASRDHRTKDGKDQTFLYDPLGGGPTRQPYDGEWIDLDALLEFNWGSGNEAVGIVWGTTTTGDRMIKGSVKRRSDKYIKLPKGTKVYDSPGGDVVRTIGNTKQFDYYGYAGNGWWAVEVWVDGGPAIAYVKKGDYERDFWPVEPVEPPPPDLSARVRELEEALESIGNIADDVLTS